MDSPKQDLRTLSRARTIGAAGGGATSVPPPRRRWRTRVLVPGVILLAFAGVLGYAARASLWPAIDVRVVPVVPKPGAPGPGGVPTSNRRGPGSVLVQAPGWIEPAPYAVSVPALVEGVVREVLVLEGDRVEADQIVARLIDNDEALRVKLAEAMIAERESEVARMRTATEQARSQVLVEAASADEVRDEVNRKRGLVEGGGISEGSFHRLELRLKALEARTAAANTAIAESEAAVAQSEAGAGVARAALNEARLRLDRTAVRAPTAGVVLARLVEPGSRISMGSRGGEGAAMSGAVVRLYDPAKLQVRVDVPLADAAKIGIGTLAEVTTEALPDKTFKGVVSRIVHEANIQRNTVQVKVALNEPVATLKPEMLTRVRFYAPPSKPGEDASTATGSGGALRLLVPIGALTDVSNDKASVWMIDQSSSRLGPIAVRREITIVPGSEEADDGYAEATASLRAGDRLVIKPPPTLTPNARVRIIDDAAARSTPAQGGH